MKLMTSVLQITDYGLCVDTKCAETISMQQVTNSERLNHVG